MSFTDLLARRKGEVIGVAALVVVLAHSYAELPIRGWHYLIIRNPAIVIDFFVLLSAFTCVLSLEKRPDFGAFFMRRLRRMLPAYYIGVALYGLVGGITSVKMLAAHIIPICTWSEETWTTYWYVSAALLYYLLIPLFRQAILGARRPWLMTLFLLAMTAIPLALATRDPDANNLSITLMRVPSAVTGTALGLFHLRRPERKERLSVLACFAGLYVLGLLLMLNVRPLNAAASALWDTHQLGYLHKAMRAPLVIVGLCLLFEGVERTPLRGLNAVLRRIGSISLELYMAHIPIRHVLYYRLGIEGWQLLAIMLVTAFPLAFGMEWATKRLLAWADGLKTKKA